MPSTFGVSEVAKGDKCIPKPEIEDFEPDFMSASNHSEFLEWYRIAIEEPYLQRMELIDAGQDVLSTYNIFEENMKYCHDDVRVLHVCFLKFF